MVTPRLIASLAAAAVIASAAFSDRASAQTVTGASVTAFEVNGIHVIALPASNQIVSIVLGLEGGIAGGETDNPAIADFAGDLVTSSGSTTYPKARLRTMLSETSTNLSSNGDLRGLTYSVTTTRPNFDRAWEMLSSLVTSPAFDETEFKNLRDRRVTDVKRRWANAEGYATTIADSLVKLGNPVLGRSVQQPDVERVDVAAIRTYLGRITERSRMLIVIVGNVPVADIKKKMAVFAGVTAGSYARPAMPPVPSASAPHIETVDRPTPTTYVNSSFAGPRAGDPDFWPLQVGLAHLRNVLFEELRTKRNLTYAPGAGLSSTLGQSRGSLSVSSTMPDSSIDIMYSELNKMKHGEFEAADLEASKQVFITSFYMRQMTNDGLASAVFAAQRNAGDWHAAFSFDAINAVKKDAVQAAFTKYARNMQVGIVGKKSLVTQEKYMYSE